VLTRIRSLPSLLALGAVVLVLGAFAVGGALQGDDEVRLAGEAASSTTSTTEAEATTTTAEPETTTTSTAEATTTTAAPTTESPATSGPSTTARPAPPPPPPAPAFASSVQGVTAEQLGASWQPGMGCPAPEDLRMLVLSHWGYDGAVHQGRLVVAAAHADRIVAAFRDLYAARFPIQRMVPIDAYGGNDQASMRANNTSGFNCRFVAGTTRLSQHGLGLAIDVNPLMNPYVRGGSVDPPEGAPYADRSRTDPGMIKPGDAAVTAFAAQGWGWGGYWSSGQDYQHFSASGR
jgi:hypothetical protein